MLGEAHLWHNSSWRGLFVSWETPALVHCLCLSALSPTAPCVSSPRVLLAPCRLGCFLVLQNLLLASSDNLRERQQRIPIRCGFSNDETLGRACPWLREVNGFLDGEQLESSCALLSVLSAHHECLFVCPERYFLHAGQGGVRANIHPKPGLQGISARADPQTRQEHEATGSHSPITVL